MAHDLAFFEEHYNVREPELADRMWEVTEHLRERCPITHSDQRMEMNPAEGFWLLSRYEDVFAVLQDWRTFSSEARVRDDEATGPGNRMPPISNDPPLQRDFRKLLNPYL